MELNFLIQLYCLTQEDKNLTVNSPNDTSFFLFAFNDTSLKQKQQQQNLRWVKLKIFLVI